MTETELAEHQHFLGLVDAMAAMSKDRSTKIGAVLYQPGKTWIGFWNHLTKGIPDDDNHNQRPEKYFYYEHAERSVIFRAALTGYATFGATLYTTGIPCADCSRAVVEAGVGTVVVWARGSGLEATNRWADSINAGREILTAADVKILEIARQKDGA